MKKITALFLALLMCVAAFAACGGSGDNNNNSADTESSAAEVKDTTYDVGDFTVAVPDGWKAIAVTDAFGADLTASKTDTIRICKGATSDFDIMTKPYAEIVVWTKKQGTMPPKTAYKTTEDLEAFSTGEHNWTGYSAETAMGKKLVILWEDTGDIQYQVNIWTETDSDKISLEDDDVKKILSSITANAAEEASSAASVETSEISE